LVTLLCLLRRQVLLLVTLTLLSNAGCSVGWLGLPFPAVVIDRQPAA
jgi:hypothetical protein